MWHKSLVMSLVFALGAVFVVQGAWATGAEVLETLEAGSVTFNSKNRFEQSQDVWVDSRGSAVNRPVPPCEEADQLVGKWTARVGQTDALGETCWGRCRLLIGAGGVIEKGKYETCLGERLRVTGGQLVLSPRCAIEGELETSRGTMHVKTGAILSNRSLILGLASF
ncbi:MAG: hypothetical protein SWQ30_23295 [Thermodesulfobacteriota bacterium]|nr:hypothetical protein [Thermodesulfobacteriota bacterium]